MSAPTLVGAAAEDPDWDELAELLAWAEDSGDWQDRGLCAQTDPDIFFPDKGGSTLGAKQVCAGCPVREQCLEYALDHDERFGIWGGVSERDRRKLKKQRRDGEAPVE